MPVYILLTTVCNCMASSKYNGHTYTYLHLHNSKICSYSVNTFSLAADADTEVSELTGCGYGPEEETVDNDEGTFPRDQTSTVSQETSSSVKAFMKQVNRIRFNSITATSGAALAREGGVAARHFRTSSCPSLDSCDSEDVGELTQHVDNPPDDAPLSIELTATQSAPVVCQASATDRVPFRKVTSDDSATTADSYTTATHPTEDFQVTFPYHLLLASLPCAPQLRCYNCLRRDRLGADSSTGVARGQCDKEDSSHKLPRIYNVFIQSNYLL